MIDGKPIVLSSDSEDFEEDGPLKPAADKPAALKYNKQTAELIEELRRTMRESRQDFVFACGGSVPIQQPTSVGKGPLTLPPISLRWDPQDPSTPASLCKLVIPGDPNTQQQQQQDVSGLVAEMAPATFGLGGKDVYDEEYRKAVKLDTSQFATNFCPYDVGIMDVVTKILVPALGDRTARAELYKLNVYEGPSGHFRAHVDTPRSPAQFGSLVVCLPIAHEGGELEVRHNDKTISFDWGSAIETGKEEPSIHWAAFYSDCEHEVLPVRSGHRVTLTYNLFAVKPEPIGAENKLDLPLVQYMDSVLKNKDFMPNGGYLGFYTSHAYPHTADSFTESTIKGIDRVIWQGFQSLGCNVRVLPVLHQDYIEMSDSDDEDFPDTVIGKGLSKMKIFYGQVDDSMYYKNYVLDSWGECEVQARDVLWLNQGMHKQMQLAFTAYGNEAETYVQYSWCAILVQVPAYDAEKGGRVEIAAEDTA
ncbi:putative 2og-fe oxygenase family protein [Podospora australis]|uniref:2og-fe oxygenase family protein n=1 Tax=Podospora australis TaxID=1536484 RepID=A0AAN6WKP9_9PEZI|nr:putative 2og-fe oxygenase family protein [Podospora australis]